MRARGAAGWDCGNGFHDSFWLRKVWSQYRPGRDDFSSLAAEDSEEIRVEPWLVRWYVDDSKIEQTMKVQTLILGSTVGATCMVLAAAGLTLTRFLEDRERQSDRQLPSSEANQAQSDALEWTEEQEAAKAELRARVEELSAEVLALKEAAQESAEAKSIRLPVQSHRVRVFLGNQEVGMGWFVPHNIRTNVANGQVGYEPVIVLDEGVREQVGVTRTNVVEREVSRPTTVNYNYQQAYASSWPVYWSRVGQKPGKQPPAAIQPQQPPAVQSPFLSTQIWHPQNPPGRPGGGWMSTGGGTGGGGGLMAPANPVRPTPFPAKY
jgi:hypothetical protein